MSWIYSGNPSQSARDEIRFLVGDTDILDQLVTDQEIAYAVTEEANNRFAAARIATAIAAKFARSADKQVGDLRISFKQRFETYNDLAARLKTEAASFGVIAYGGGISVSDVQTIKDNTDLVKPDFERGLFDFEDGDNELLSD